MGMKVRKRIRLYDLYDFSENSILFLREGFSFQDTLSLNTEHDRSCSNFTSAFSAYLLNGLRKGKSMVLLLSQYSRECGYLPSFFSHSLTLAEDSGCVLPVFGLLEDFLRKKMEFKEQMSGALFYPVLVLLLTSALVGAVRIFLLPMLQTFSGTESRPEPGCGLIITCSFIAAAVLFLLDYLLRKNNSLSFILFRRLPIVREFLVAQDIVALSYDIQIRLTGGTGKEKALRDAAGVLQLPSLRKDYEHMMQMLRKGESTAYVLKTPEGWQSLFARWFYLAYAGGNAARAFSCMGSFYTKRLRRYSSALFRAAEPAAILITGIVFTVLILRLLLPFFGDIGIWMQ